MADLGAAGGTGIREPTAIPVGLTSLSAGAPRGANVTGDGTSDESRVLACHEPPAF